jgi:hypothetical protein
MVRATAARLIMALHRLFNMMNAPNAAPTVPPATIAASATIAVVVGCNGADV